MSINFSEDAQQEVVTSSRVLPEDSGEGSLRPRLLRDYTGQEKAKRFSFAFSCPVYSASVFGRKLTSPSSCGIKLVVTIGAS